MNKVRWLSHDSGSDRELFALSVPNFSEIPSFDLGSRYFCVFLVGDVRETTTENLVAFGRALLDLGGVYFCCWGPGCEKAHDAIDYADRGNERPGDSVVMTTWHDNEPLSEAIWFFLNSAFPTELYESECRASIAITVDSKSWAEECIAALSNPRKFSELD